MNKTVLPQYLKEFMDEVDFERLLPPALAKCGIFPLNPDKVLERLPSGMETYEL